eukprot:CAMPEP_0170433518 /NCGR_PEP_ID=MMETSP0117_2-20130122/42547_1 /TAXON_ID=400756 /ORGANISM="Durinskia baltica, Strain CSIRO CS-38" /LENGTH=716 /DNA_ID=CAMNT_0010693285 /DNA_START=37 /DNA_END=2187 /DNA_ORIENTATION=-
MTTVPGFLTRTFEIFSSPEYSDCCGWGPNGDTIVIKKIEQFAKEIVPKYFKHSNFQSFVRQLNMYDFHKTVQDPSHGEFAHEYFKKGQPELLIHIKRKANKAPIATSTIKSKSSKGGGISNGGSVARNSQAISGGGVSSTGMNVSRGSGSAAASNVAHLSSVATGGGGGLGVGLSGGLGTSQQLGAVTSAGPIGSLGSNMIYPTYSVDLDDTLGGNEHLRYYVDEGTGNAYPVTSGGGGGGGIGNGVGTVAGGGASAYYGESFSPGMLPDDIVNETDNVMMELTQQRAQRESFERRMEQKLANLQGENNMLKRMFMESHHKNAVMQERMERVMKTLYTMFMGGSGGNAPGMALTNRAPSMLLTDIQHFNQQQQRNGGETIDVSVLEEAGANNSVLGGRSGSLPTPQPLNSIMLERMRSTDNNMARLDSTSLERLPSLDLSDLDDLGNSPAGSMPLNDTAGGSSSGAGGTNNHQYMHLLRRANAGAALSGESRGNSFDLAASAVTAPSLLRQTSFDAPYLPRVNPAGARSSHSPVGRTYLEAGNGVSQKDGNSGSGVPEGVPLMRQRTFDYIPEGADNTVASGAPGSAAASPKTDAATDGKGKRKVGDIYDKADQESGKRGTRLDANDNIEGELKSLESEDVHSSLHEAHEFMDLLNRNQQTTLTRLDSLEQTIASLFEASTDHAESDDVTTAASASASASAGAGAAGAADGVAGLK